MRKPTAAFPRRPAASFLSGGESLLLALRERVTYPVIATLTTEAVTLSPVRIDA